jgi:replicative superfamily II helicase
LPDLVEAQLAIADAELGVETRLRGLLRRGIAVHTVAMLQVEQAAAEWMFADGKVKLMIATGTLAQGLNLPAVGLSTTIRSSGSATLQ